MDAQAHAAKADWVRAALERHGAALTRYAASVTGSEDAARDVVQDVFLRLWEASPERLDGHLTEWLFTVCRNRSIDMQRKGDRMSALTDEQWESTVGAEPDPSMEAERQDTLGVALGLLRGLSGQQQEVVRLKFQAGLSYEEIARVTGLTSGHVGFILHTALKTLRQRLKQAL
jgi:RNA polymerase sigma-70 factor (ECF subfamily)